MKNECPLQEWETIAGYEVPRGTAEEIRAILNVLQRNGVIRIISNDGASHMIVKQIQEIAEDNGLRIMWQDKDKSDFMLMDKVPVLDLT
jgi:hypothetical protein